MKKPTAPAKPRKFDSPPSKTKTITGYLFTRNGKLVVILDSYENLFNYDHKTHNYLFEAKNLEPIYDNNITYKIMCYVKKQLPDYVEDFYIRQEYSDEYPVDTLTVTWTELKNEKEYNTELEEYNNRFVKYEREYNTYLEKLNKYNQFKTEQKKQKLKEELAELERS